jgi:hypothetical protein
MTNQKLSSTLVIGWVAVPALAIFLGAGAARAQNNTAHYILLVAAGFLCDSSDSSTSPAVVKSSNGDTYEMVGAGTFDAQSKSATAAGTYALKSSSGDVLETGVWVASELVSFDLYGIAPGAIMGGGRALGPPPFSPKRFPIFSGCMAAGGRAVLRIRLLPVLGLAKNAMLQINCALGKVPPEHQVEGIRLAFEGGGVEFDEEISGRAMFLMTRPGASTAAKAPTPEVDAKPAPPELQQ